MPREANVAPVIGSLRRNQACHTCRKSKRKCDAKKPCTPCIKAQARTGEVMSCTYDEVAPRTAPAPRNKFERLEGRINELESLLASNTRGTAGNSSSSDLGAGGHSSSSAYSSSQSGQGSSAQMITSAAGMDSISLQATNILAGLPHVIPSFMAADSEGCSKLNLAAASREISMEADPLLMELLWPSWPARLPPPNLLHHLVDIFFASHPHADRLLHRPTFLASLALPPNHPNFPHTCLLHAICALASLHNDPSESNQFRYLVGMFQPKNHRVEETFGEMHMRYSKDARAECMRTGESMLHGLQSTIVISWYYFSMARWAEVWFAAGEAMRFTIPLCLNVTSTYNPLRSWKTPPILVPTKDPIEAETRRSTFWLAYTTERWHSCCTDMTTVLDDDDVTQVLPVTYFQFHNGVHVPKAKRQRILDPDVLLNHPAGQTDAFSLYIKGTLLLSRVRTFNHRFKSKLEKVTHDLDSDDEEDAPEDHVLTGQIMPHYTARYRVESIDPRSTAQFKELDETIQKFRDSFPKDLRDPFSTGTVDSNLYVACLAPYVASILLHEPHADVANPDCTSANRLWESCRAVLDLIYAICSTSYDLGLLDHGTAFAWYAPCRVLVRCIQYKMEQGQRQEAIVLMNELEFIKLALLRMGDRLPLGEKQAGMIDALILRFGINSLKSDLN